MADVIPIRARQPHTVRGLTPAEVDYLRRELAPIRAQHELRRLREKHERWQRIVLIAAFALVGFIALYAIFQAGRAY
jgi:hypothetical protein